MKIVPRFGFTLIEVMVVVGIIGILSAVSYGSFREARTNARDKALRANFTEIQLAFEVYKAQYDVYPTTVTDLIPTFYSGEITGSENRRSANSACRISYYVSAGRDSYKLTGHRCVTEVVATDDALARCPSSCATCNGSTFDAGYRVSDSFYESIAIYGGTAQCQ